MRLYIATALIAAFASAVPLSDSVGQTRITSPSIQTAPKVLPQTETRLNLRRGQRLNLKDGSYLILRRGFILEYIEMNGLIARSFRNASIVQDGSGVVWIVSGRQRVRAGTLQR